MATTTADNIQIIGGVDTHQDLHTAAVVSHDGTVLGTASFSTTRAGYPEAAPPYPVAWVVWGGDRYREPWGERIDIGPA